MKFYYSWTWCLSFVLFVLLAFLAFFICSLSSVDFFSFFFCFFCYCGFSISILIPIVFFLSILTTLPSPSSHQYSHPFHSPSFSCAKIHCSSPQQLILPLLTHSLPLPSPSPLILFQPITRLPLPPTHSSPAECVVYLLYKT